MRVRQVHKENGPYTYLGQLREAYRKLIGQSNWISSRALLYSEKLIIASRASILLVLKTFRIRGSLILARSIAKIFFARDFTWTYIQKRYRDRTGRIRLI